MKPIEKPTPLSTQTRPSLAQIDRRIGTHGAFKEAMQRGMFSRHRPGLQAFQTQSDEDWTVALLDAWAGVLDNLAFYNERISNEAYLSTATETFSVQELAALVGYSLSPALAAEAWLAFTADESVLDRSVIALDPGLQVKSIPEEGELPQTFETKDILKVKSTWNDLRPLTRWPQSLTAYQDGFYADLTQDSLRIGDRLAFLDGQGVARRANAVPPSTSGQILRSISQISPLSGSLAWVETMPGGTPSPLPETPGVKLPQAEDFETPSQNGIADLMADLVSKQWPRANVLDAAAQLEITPQDLSDTLQKLDRASDPLKPVVFREKCRFLGHNAVSRPALKSGADTSLLLYEHQTVARPWVLSTQSDAIEDDDMRAAEASSGTGAGRMISILLDRKYDSVVAGSLVVIRGRRDQWTGHGRQMGAVVERWLVVEDVETLSVEAFGLSGEVTRLRVPALWNGRRVSDMLVRTAELFVASSNVTLPDLPLSEDVSGSEVLLNQPDLDLAPGQSMILSGERADMLGVVHAERVKIKEVWTNASVMRLTFETPLALAYQRNSVRIHGNVARATHGEVGHEILGSGDGRVAFQRFKLKGAPLTYISADTPTGRLPEIDVRVDGVRWNLVPSLDGAGPDDRVYTVTTREDGASEVMFGGAGKGARLPTGENNVAVTYRKGAGAQGRLKAGQLSLLVSKPRSLKAVSNPLPTSGGAAAERLEDARKNAPKGLLTLGRIVSLGDYETFATGFAGISKARADWSWVAEDQHVFLTVAGEDEAPLLHTDSVVTGLSKACLDYAAPGTGLTIRAVRVAHFTLKARLLIDPAYRAADGSAETVLLKARARLREVYGFALRGIGDPVRASDIIVELQSVSGVRAVDLDLLHRTDRAAGLENILRADVPRTGGHGSLLGAEILLLGADPVELEAL